MRPRRLTITIRPMRRSLPWTNLKRFSDGLNTLRSPDGTRISQRLLVAVSRLTPPMPRATCYARWEFQMSSSIVSSRRDVDRMHSMEQPTIPRWTSKQHFLSLALEPPQPALRTYPRHLESKTWSCIKVQIQCFASLVLENRATFRVRWRCSC